ncbi:unnamed protein product [Rotaria magnacalcarata]|uniref:GAR domain-containing protein n=2 Tax=Rotaria magnacalcarata TaxID=392030 RepID=A0A815ZUQ7_9BILA|nr:unnamed protein product [Rotaria magnacalcarata]
MQRSFSTSSVDHQHYRKSSGMASQFVPIQINLNNLNKVKDYYSSDIDFHQTANLQRTSSTSSFASSTSTNSANYRILPVRYSSVDRVIDKSPIITANEHGINVRIHFKYPHRHRHRHQQQQQQQYEQIEENHRTEKHESLHEKRLTKEHEQYGSCPVLNKINLNSNSLSVNPRRQSNINYIETRSIIRTCSTDRLDKNTHSSTLIIRHQSLPPVARKNPPKILLTHIKHIPLETSANFQPIITRDFENDLLSQASRIKDIRNLVRQDYNSSSHHELRSLVNQTSDYAQDLFTASKEYSDKLDMADTALSLVSDLTSHVTELETRLASHTPLIDDEQYIHRQLDDLNELDGPLESIEKSIKELLIHSKQLGSDRLIRISEQLAFRWQQINSEIKQRKRSITQCLETRRSFQTLYQQEEHILDTIQQRIETLEPVPNDPNKLRQLGKTVLDTFNEILARAQSIEHMNDVAVKFIEETKMHDKSLKRFRVSLHESHPNLDASISIIRRQYPTNLKRATRSILQKVEIFDRRYADLLADMEEYARTFVKNFNATGQTINLPLDSASSIVHLYRSTIACRYNIASQYLLSSDDDDEEQIPLSSNSTKHNRQSNNNNNNKAGFIDVTRGKTTVDHHSYSVPSSSLDGSVSFETTYLIPSTQNDSSNNKKVRFIIQKQPGTTSTTNSNIIVSSTKLNEMAQRKNLSFVDAVNSKYLDLSTGLFSSLPFVLSSSSFSSSQLLSPDQHRHPHTHFSSSSPPHTTITTTDNKNLLASSVSVNNHPSLVSTDSNATAINTSKTITLKEAIDTNILDAHSAYIVDTLEQRNYDLREAYSRGLITTNDHHIIDRARNQHLTLADALKMGILKLGDPQSYNIISKTESLIISSVFDHCANTFIDPNTAIRKKILDPYHGLYINNLTQESISIDDAMNKNFIIVEPQTSHSSANQHNDKYVISTSLIRETRSYHLLGVRDYINNKELSVQEAIRLGILDKQNGQYINRKTNEIFSISEAISQGHIRAQPLPVEGSSLSSTTTTANGQETIGTTNIKRGTVKETKTYTLKSAIHPRTRKEIPIRQAIDEGIIDHAKGFYVNSITGENLPISVAIERGLIFTELIDQNAKYVKYIIIEQVIDPITNRRLGITEAIQSGLLNSTVTAYHHPVKQRQMSLMEAYEQGFIIGKLSDQKPSSFIGDQRQQTFYLITNVTDIRTERIYNLQEATEQKLFDRRKCVYIHPITGDEINIGDAVKRGFIQVQAVSSQISTANTRSNLSVRIESQTPTVRPPTAHLVQREKDIIEIESVQRVPKHRRHHHTTTEETIEQHTTNVIDKEVYINRGRSSERPKQRYIEEVIIDDDRSKNRKGTVDIKEERQIIHKEIIIDSDRIKPQPPTHQIIIDETSREREFHVIHPPRPQPPVPPRPTTHISTTKKEYIEEIDHRFKPTPRPDDIHDEQQQSWSEEEWEQWHCIMMVNNQPYRVVWVMNTATGDRLPLQNAYQRSLVDTKQRLFFDEKLNRQSYSFEKAVELGYMGIEPDTASLPIRVDGIDYMVHWVLDSSTKRRIFPRQAITKHMLDAKTGRYINPYNNSQVSLHEAIHLKFVGATEYGSVSDSITVTINGQPYVIKWVYDTVHMKKILPRDALRQGILDIQQNEYRKFDTNDVMTIYDAIQASYIRCTDDDSSSDNSVRPPSIISVDEDELTIATKTATYVITSVIHPLTQKEIKVSEAIDLGILDKETGSYRDLVTNAQYELAEAINEGLVYATIIETKEDTEMMTSSVQEITKKFIVKSVAIDSDSTEKIGGLEAQAVGILNYAQGVYHDRKYGVKIPLDKAIERKLLDVELVSQKKFEEYDLELITDTITEKRITLYKIHGVQNNVLGRMESGAVAVRNQMIDTEAKTFTDFSTGETMTIQEAVNRNLIQAEISEHVERKPLGLSMQNAIRLGFYVAETGTFRDPATEHYMPLMEAIDRGHIHVNGVAFADSEQGSITLYDAFSLGLINRRDGGKLNAAKMALYRARLVESKLHRMNVEDAIRCGLLNLRTGLYKHPHSGEQLNLKEAIQRGLIDGQSTVIENQSTGRYMTLKEALDGIKIDNDGQVIDSYSNKVITTLELAYNHRKLFSQFDVNAGEIFLPAQNESIGFEKAVRKNLLDNNRIKLFDPKTSREYSVQDAIERGIIDHESGLIYDPRSRTTYSIREAIRHGIIAVVGAPLVPIKADHETVAAKITSRNRRRHSLAKSSLHFDYNSAPESADEDSQGSGGWHRITSKNRPISPLSADGKRSIRRRTGSSPSRNNTNRFTCRDGDWRTGWKGDDDDDNNDDDTYGRGSKGFVTSANYTSTTTSRTQDKTNNVSNQSQGGRTTSTGFQQKQENSSITPAVNAKVSSVALMVHLLNDYDQMMYLIMDSFSSMFSLSYYVYLLTLVHSATHSIFEPSSSSSPTLTKTAEQNPNELAGQKSKLSFYVQPNTQVSHEPSSSSLPTFTKTDEKNPDKLPGQKSELSVYVQPNTQKSDHSFYVQPNTQVSHEPSSPSSPTLTKADEKNPDKLPGQKSELSFCVQPNTQVSDEPPSSSKIESISEDDGGALEDFSNSSNTKESPLITVLEKKQEEINDNSLKNDDTEQAIENDDNRIIVAMHDVANRLTSLHEQLNQYVYLTDNLNELRTNVEQIKKLHGGVDKQKTAIDNIVEHANNVNPELATLSQDLEEKRVEIADINSGLSDIIERFIDQVNQFNTDHDRLNEWIETNNKEIQRPLQLSTITVDNEKFHTILAKAISLQYDLESLQEHLQSIDSTILDFEQATGNTDGGKSANIYKQLEQRFDILSSNYTDFLKRCKQVSDQCERYMATYNEVNDLNRQIIKSMNEFDRNLTSNQNKQQNDNKLQVLLLNVQQQLDKLGILATHEPVSPSPIMSTSDHIQNQIREHLCTLLDSHTKHYDEAQQGLMHNFEVLEHDNHERQTMKERIDELNHWLLSYTDQAKTSSDLFSKPLSLKRTKLDEQIINFRQFHAQLLARSHSFESDINTKLNIEQLFDENDKKNIELINQSFQLLDEQANHYNERINRLSTRLNEFHLEHVHLMDNYSKRLRLYSEHIEQNDDINFSTLQLLLNNNNESVVDHTLYEQLSKELIQTDNIEDENEIHQYETKLNECKKQYEKFENDLKLILGKREKILNEYELKKNSLQDWLLVTERLLKQQPNELTILTCQQLLIEHLNMPIEQMRVLNQQLIEFYSPSNLNHLYEQLKLDKNTQHNSNITTIVQRQTDDLIENYLSIKEKIFQHINLLEKIEQQTTKYQAAKEKAEISIEKAKELVTLEENTILPLDDQQIEIMLNKYKSIADQFKHMSSTIDEYKTSGLTLINTAQRYIDTEPIQNEISTIDKSWSEYIEYILDTIDYIQLHQEDLREFHQLSNDLINLLNEKQLQMEALNDNEVKAFHDDLEKYYEQIESINQKGELLLQSSAINLNDDNENRIEHLLETINRNYDSLTVNTKARLQQITNTQQSTPLPTTTTTTTTTVEEASTVTKDELISPEMINKVVDELHHYIEETVVAMNELSELLVSSTNDQISAQPIKLSEQLLDNAAVQNELEKRKIAIEQLHANVETLKQMMTTPEDLDSMKILDEKCTELNDHWSIMKQANDIRTENLLLAQTCANTFWSEHGEISSFLNNISKQLSQIRPRSTSREHIEHEKEKFNQVINDFSNYETKFKEILEQHGSILLTLVANNPEEAEEVQHSLNELEQEWNRTETNLNTCQNQLEQAMIESAEFNSKLERVSTWFDDTTIPISVEDNDEFERIRVFKEHLDCKYLDIINLKQDYTDIEQHKQQTDGTTIEDNKNNIKEKEKTNIVELQLDNIDSKWTHLNDKIHEHKTLIYETALRQNRVDDVVTDINRSLDNCSSKLSVLINCSSDANLNDIKPIEISIAKLRILLNDIELISYDIEQLKHNSLEDKISISSINNRWEELLKQATDKYNYLENKLEYMKLKQKTIDNIYNELDLIDNQVNDSTINTKFPLLVERLEFIEEEINRELSNDDDNNQQIEELKKRLIDVKQQTITKGQALIELAHSIELFHSSLQKFTEWLNQTERYLNNLKPVQRRFALIQTLLKQIDDHELLQAQLQTYKEHLIDLDKLATHLKFVSPKNDSIYIRNSLIAAQTRWQKVLTRTTERTKELQKAFQETKKTIRPEVTDIDRIKTEVNRQASLCTCSKKYDVQQVAEGRYRFGESQSLRLVRILRSTVMVRVGGGWTALDEFLVRHDPCRAKGRTNYELHPENYALRDGVAQTMTLFKPRLVTVHRPTCLFHQQQLAAAGTLKQSPVTTPNRGTKDKSRRTSSIVSSTPPQQQRNASSIGDLSASGDDLVTSPHVLSDFETKPPHIPIAVVATTPVASTLSRTSSRESVLSEHSIASTSSTQQRRPSKLPLPISRQKKATNGTTPVKNS